MDFGYTEEQGAVLKNFSLHIRRGDFDEATSALDYRNEGEILDRLLENAGEKTVLMVTHRGTSAGRCGRVVRVTGR